VRCALAPSLAPRIPPENRPGLGDKIRSTFQIALPMLLILLVLGSIWFGIATPSEAAGIGALGTLAIAILRRQLGLATLPGVLIASARVSAMVLALLIGGALFSRLLQLSGSARMIADAMVGIDVGVMGTLLIFIAVTTVLGMFIDGAAIIFIVTPIMMPVIQTLGIDPVWFGVTLMIAIAAGYVTPPFGMNLFFLRGIVDQVKGMPGCEPLAEVTLADIWASCLPYIVIMYVALALVLMFPELATWLPAQMH
jgi:tripartite ATP-independent transporter DctM subunit